MFHGVMFALCLGGSAVQPGSAVVRGKVTDDIGVAVAGAIVRSTPTKVETRTDDRGFFQLNLVQGTHQLRVQRIGFAPHISTIEVSGQRNLQETDTIHVTLSPVATLLRDVITISEASTSHTYTDAAITTKRQPPLIEVDALRSLSMVGGIAQTNDLLNRFHIAGGASDEHGYFLDGHPVQSTMHVSGTFSAFNANAVERVEVGMHHIPALRDGRLSGEVHVHSVRASERPRYTASLGLLSASATAVRTLPGRVEALGSIRRSWLDQAARIALQRSRGDDWKLPGFSDYLLRASRTWNSRVMVELLAFSGRDGLSGRPQHAEERPLTSVESLLGARMQADFRGLRVRGRLSRNDARVRNVRYGESPNGIGTFDTTDIHQSWIHADLGVERVFHDGWLLRAGSTIAHRRHSHRWGPLYASELLRGGGPMAMDTIVVQTTDALYAELEYGRSERWSASAGTHVTRVRNAAYASPRGLLSYRVNNEIRFDFSANRRHQFDAIAAEPHDVHFVVPSVLLQRPRRADGVALSMRWLPAGVTEGRTVSNLTVFARRYSDRVVAPLDSTVGRNAEPAISLDTLEHVRSRGVASGVSLRVQTTMANGGSAHFAYALQRISERVGSRTVPAAWDFPHQFTALVGFPVYAGWSVTGSFFARSGAAITPVLVRVLEPQPGGGLESRLIAAEPRSGRLPMYHRVDLGLRREWRRSHSTWSLNAGVMNVLARTNPLAISWESQFRCGHFNGGDCTASASTRRGVPMIPSVAMEVSW